jgi:hypothetical protein
MFTYASTVTVARAAHEVFEAVNDISGWTDWTDMRDVRISPPAAVRIGATGTFTMPGPFTGPIRFELTEMEPNRRVRYAISHPSFNWTAEIAVEPETVASSRLTTRGQFRMRGWRRLLEPIVAREVRRGEATELIRLKALLEASPTVVAATA